MERLLRVSEVIELTGISHSHLYHRIADGTFPSPLKIGKKSVRFRESDIAMWFDELRVTKTRIKTTDRRA